MPEVQTAEQVQPQEQTHVQAPAVYWPEQGESAWAIDVTWAPAVDTDTGERLLLPLGVAVRCFDRDTYAALPGGLRPVTRALFREMPMAALIERSRVALLEQQRADLEEMMPLSGGFDLLGMPPDDRTRLLEGVEVLDAADASEGAPRQGRPADRDGAFFRLVADLYREARAGGGEPAHKPAKYVERRLRERGAIDATTAPAQVRKFIQQARRRGHLPPTEERRAGFTAATSEEQA